MKTKEFILETDIEVSLPFSKNNQATYNLKCYDGYAIGERTCDNEKAPKTIRMEYPTLEEVLASTKKTERILDYRGLYDLEAKDIHYGDIMITFGKVVK
jgi:hypothetical protein